MTVPRYYAQHCELDPSLGTDDSGWQIFDRQFTDNRGQCRAIALAKDRAAAFKIRDALNAAEKE